MGQHASTPSSGLRASTTTSPALFTALLFEATTRMLAEGLANKNIAFRLGISEHTVKFHIASIYTKRNASSRAEAMDLAAAMS
jgi:DNA-binding NarL/FixJ family response regulator